MCEVCACDSDSVREGSACARRGSWPRRVSGCWAVTGMAGRGGWASIWLPVELRINKSISIKSGLE